MDCQVLYRIQINQSEKYYGNRNYTQVLIYWDNFWLWCLLAVPQLELIPGPMWRAPYICGYDALGMRSNIGPGISVPRRTAGDVPTRHLDPDLWSIRPPGVIGTRISSYPNRQAQSVTGAYVLMDQRSALDGSGRSLARFYWLQLHCVSGPLILSFAGRWKAASVKLQAASHKQQALDKRQASCYN